MIIDLRSVVRPVVESAVSVGQAGLLTVLPHGGQAIARRNAYKAVLHDETAAAHRRRVLEAVDRASASASGSHLISISS
jgi:hypothetical protein